MGKDAMVNLVDFGSVLLFPSLPISFFFEKAGLAWLHLEKKTSQEAPHRTPEVSGRIASCRPLLPPALLPTVRACVKSRGQKHFGEAGTWCI